MPIDTAGLRGWLDRVTTTRIDADNRAVSP
jgi:hypothetical protein